MVVLVSCSSSLIQLQSQKRKITNNVLCKKYAQAAFWEERDEKQVSTKGNIYPTYSWKFRIIHYFEVLVSITDKIHVLGGKHLHKRTLAQDLDQVVKGKEC